MKTILTLTCISLLWQTALCYRAWMKSERKSNKAYRKAMRKQRQREGESYLNKINFYKVDND